MAFYSLALFTSVNRHFTEITRKLIILVLCEWLFRTEPFRQKNGFEIFRA